MKFDIGVFLENLWGKFSLKSDKNLTGAFRENVCTFVIISRSVLLRRRNVSDKSCRENQNTVFSNLVFPKIVPFVRLCGKIR
jgi:hypothetical protein